MALPGVPATQNHKLNVPEEGFSDWDDPLNDNFDELDRRVPIRDLEENRSEYNPRHNAKFEATDTGKMWYGDGSSWNLYGAIGTTSWSNDGNVVKSDPNDVNFGSGINLTDDGTGEGVTISVDASDADTVDGYHGSDLGVLSESETVTGGWQFNQDVDLRNGAKIDLRDSTPSDLFRVENTGDAGGKFTTRVDDADYRFWLYESSTDNGSEVLRLEYDSKDVVIPEGTLKFDTDSYSGIDNINELASEQGRNLNIGANGSNGTVKFYDFHNDQDVLTGHVGGTVTIPNGNLSLKGNNINDASHIRYQHSGWVGHYMGTNTGAIAIRDPNGDSVAVFRDTNDVEIPNGNLTVSGDLTTNGDTVTTNSTLVVGPGPEDSGDAMIEMKPGTDLESQIRWYDGAGVSQVSYWWETATSEWHAYDQNNGRFLFTYDQGGNSINFRNVPVDFRASVELSQGATAQKPINISGTELQLSGSTALTSVAASGSVTLSSGIADVDTGVSSSDATFMLAIGCDTNDAKVSGRLYRDSGTATYHVEIVENGTSVGNPTVDYDVIRVK